MLIFLLRLISVIIWVSVVIWGEYVKIVIILVCVPILIIEETKGLVENSEWNRRLLVISSVDLFLNHLKLNI